MKREYDPDQPQLARRASGRRVPRLDGTFYPDGKRAAIVEPKVTGPSGNSPVKVTYRGNIALAKQYLGAGKKQLGMMRMTFDVGDRVEYEEEGMYWTRRSKQADGTLITTLFNERLQEITIDAPFPPTSEPEEEEPPPKLRTHGYLWVGARINWEMSGASSVDDLWNGYWSYSMAVSEPGADGEPAGAGILFDGGNVYWNGWAYYGTVMPGTYLRPPWGDRDTEYFSPSRQISEANLYYDNLSGGYCFPPGLGSGWSVERLNFLATEEAFDAAAPDGFRYNMMAVSKHGGRMYDARWGGPDSLQQYVMAPFDPENPSYEDSGYVLPNDALFYNDGTWRTAPAVWTSVYVVDPSEGLPMLLNADGKPLQRNWPTSTRLQDVRFLDYALNELGGSRTDMAKPGFYAVKLFGVGADCSCANPGDYPVYVDLEVRSGKWPATRTYRTTVLLSAFAEGAVATMPFGQLTYTCGVDQGVGAGTMCENWWPGAIIADLYGNIEEVEYFLPDYLPGSDPCGLECDAYTVMFMVSWCGFQSTMNWMLQEGCSTVSECIGDALGYAIDYLSSEPSGPPCHAAVQFATPAELQAGWEALWGTVDPYSNAAAIYDPNTKVWSKPPSNCQETCWTPYGDGCVESYVGTPAFQWAIVDGIGWMQIVPGVYCNTYHTWYDGWSCGA